MDGYTPADNIWKTLKVGKTKYYKVLKELELTHYKDENGKVYVKNDDLKLIQDFLEVQEESDNKTKETNSGELVKSAPRTVTHVQEAEVDFAPEDKTNGVDQQAIINQAMAIRAQQEVMPELVAISLAGQMEVEDLTPELRKAIADTKAAVNPKHQAESAATSLLAQWRSKKAQSPEAVA